jgi:hypothetical protein
MLTPELMVFDADPWSHHVVMEKKATLVALIEIDPKICNWLPEKVMDPRVLLVTVNDLQTDEPSVVMV